MKQVTILENKKILGMAIYKILDLDSDILGFKTAKIDSIKTEKSLQKKLIQKLIKSFIKEKIRYVTFRLNAKDLAMINSLEEGGFRLIDEYLILIKELGEEYQEEEYSVNIREANPGDSEKLQKEIGSTFIYSRFFNDSLIKKEAAVEMHKVWINNCVAGQAAEKVFVAEEKGKLVGFIAIETKESEGHIPLIGVSPKFRGKKISQQLTLYAIQNCLRKMNINSVRIETQLTNIPAARAYENIGFRLTDSAVTLRWAQGV